MKAFRWDEQKNEWLKANRGIGFEPAALKIEGGDVLDIINHRNRERYPNQRIFILKIGGYAHLVPFVETETEIFLKTIIPNRQATRRFLGGGQLNG
ncbi:MAG: BrnT family toxin [Elusimicrobia bacterium]|nr:BrnT family toxin [Elusimicrobiota bacterium]